MGILEFFNEGQVYEVLLITRSNVAPVGVVRAGRVLSFRLFGGRSAGELGEYPYASIQITNDAELLVKLALNFETHLEFEGDGRYRWIRGLPGVYGEVKSREKEYVDEIGKTKILECSLEPKGFIEGNLPPRPLSRADFHLIEMAVHLTRLLPAVEGGKEEVVERLYDEVISNYRMYKRFGGRSEVADRMVKMAKAGLGESPKNVR